MNEWNENGGFATAVQAENELTLSRYAAGVMRKVYGKMTIGLLVTALTSWIMLSSEALLSVFLGSKVLFFGSFILELGLVFFLSARIDKLSTSMATALFYLYSVLNGVTLTPIFLVYTQTSIATTFAITAGTFGVMTIAGYVTRKDLSKFGSYLFMTLIGLVLCLEVNMFMQNPVFDLFISIAGVAIFVGLTAWDTQNIKRMAAQADPSMMGKVATMGALTLYLDFINLFIYLLRFFGSRD